MKFAVHLLAAIGCLFVGAGIGMTAERLGMANPYDFKLAMSIAALLFIWIVA